MPEPETDWVGRAIPPAPGWIVNRRWYGLFTLEFYDSPERCFAANRTCEQVLVREPISHGRAVTNAGPVRADLNAGHSAGHGSHPDAGTDANAQPLRGDAPGRAGDSDSASSPYHLRADNGCAGNPGGVLLDGGSAHAESDADAATVRDAGAGHALPEGVLSHVD